MVSQSVPDNAIQTSKGWRESLMTLLFLELIKDWELYHECIKTKIKKLYQLSSPAMNRMIHTPPPLSSLASVGRGSIPHTTPQTTVLWYHLLFHSKAQCTMLVYPLNFTGRAIPLLCPVPPQSPPQPPRVIKPHPLSSIHILSPIVYRTIILPCSTDKCLSFHAPFTLSIQPPLWLSSQPHLLLQ